MAFYTYAEIESGFSGYFDELTVPGKKSLTLDSVWFGYITGTDATIKSLNDGAIYTIYVDGVASTPTVNAGVLTLFTGLADVAHEVSIYCTTASADTGNGFDKTETQIMEVTGASPLVTPVPIKYLGDPTYNGLTSEILTTARGGNITPTFDRKKIGSEERGWAIINAQCDTLVVLTGDTAVRVSVDNGTPVLYDSVPAVDANINIRVVTITGLDDTQAHQYAVWGETTVSYGISGVSAVLANAPATLNAVAPKEIVGIYGDSIVRGSGSSDGAVDAWQYGTFFDLNILKAGYDGYRIGAITTEITRVITETGIVPDTIILCSGMNDRSFLGTVEADYRACIDQIISLGVPRLRCRLVTPNGVYESSRYAIDNIIRGVVAEYDGIYDVEVIGGANWTGIATVDGVHPTEAGQVVMAEYMKTALKPTFDPYATPTGGSAGVLRVKIDNPSSTITDMVYELELNGTNIPEEFWADNDTDDLTKGRMYKDSDESELASEWLYFDKTKRIARVRLLYTGDILPTGDYIVRIQAPKASRSSYLPTDTYGSNNVYPAAIVGSYPVDGDTTTLTDRTGNGQSGTPGTDVYIADGRISYSPGNTGLALMSGKSLDGASAFNLSFTCRFASFDEMRFFLTDTFAFEEPIIFWKGADDRLNLLVTVDGTTTTNIVTSTVVLSSETDYRLELNWDGSNVRLYINAVEDTTSPLPYSLVGSALNATGSAAYSLGQSDTPMIGQIWDVEFKTEINSPAKIEADYLQKTDNANYFTVIEYVAGTRISRTTNLGFNLGINGGFE